MATAAGKIFIAYGQDANGDTFPDSVLATITAASSNPLGVLYNYVPMVLAAGAVLMLAGIVYQHRRTKSDAGQSILPQVRDDGQLGG